MCPTQSLLSSWGTSSLPGSASVTGIYMANRHRGPYSDPRGPSRSPPVSYNKGGGAAKPPVPRSPPYFWPEEDQMATSCEMSAVTSGLCKWPVCLNQHAPLQPGTRRLL